MLDWFLWNNTRCTAYGIHVLTQPELIRPAERATFTSVPGRSGSGQLQSASVGSLQVKTAAIGAAHIQQAAIQTAHIEDASITRAKIAEALIDVL